MLRSTMVAALSATHSLRTQGGASGLALNAEAFGHIPDGAFNVIDDVIQFLSKRIRGLTLT